MRESDFSIFLVHFKAAGRDVHALNGLGLSLLDIVKTHAQSQAFADLLSA